MPWPQPARMAAPAGSAVSSLGAARENLLIIFGLVQGRTTMAATLATAVSGSVRLDGDRLRGSLAFRIADGPWAGGYTFTVDAIADGPHLQGFWRGERDGKPIRTKSAKLSGHLRPAP